jgi:hypothetical protein
VACLRLGLVGCPLRVSYRPRVAIQSRPIAVETGRQTVTFLRPGWFLHATSGPQRRLGHDRHVLLCRTTPIPSLIYLGNHQ